MEILTEAHAERIVGEALGVLQELGVFVENDDALELLGDAGCEVEPERRRVRIPERLVRSALETAPSSFDLFDREGEKAVHVGERSVTFDPGSAAVRIYDPGIGEERTPTSRDCGRFVRILEAMPNLRAQSTGLVSADVPEPFSDRYRLLFALAYSRKPVITGTFRKEGFWTMREMLLAVRGSDVELRTRPLAVFDCCPSPPLRWSDLTAQNLIDCARTGIPAELVSMPLTGATSPVTLHGALVQHTAESLSGVVIHQLASPGAPIVYGGSPAAFDMRRGTTPMGAIETMMIDVSYNAIGGHLGLPTHAYMGLSDAKSPDYQGGFETGMGAVLAALAGVNVVSGAGMQDFESAQCLEKLVLDDEICGMCYRLLDGVRKREGTFDILAEAADSGNFLAHPSTLRLFREELHVPGAVVDRRTYEDWRKAGAKDAMERAHEEVLKVLEEEPNLLDREKIGELKTILLTDGKKYDVETLPLTGLEIDT
jgi:trimethylamine--corrinoid protein Co-methyltransferase